MGTRQGHRVERALRGCHSPKPGAARPAQHSRGGCRGQENAGTYPGQYPGYPPNEGRRYRRLHRHRRDAQVFYPQGSRRPAVPAKPAHYYLRSLWLDPGGTPRYPRISHERRRARSLPDRRTDGGGHRCRTADRRPDRLDGTRHRWRHQRGRCYLARRYRLLALAAHRRRQDG